MKLSEITKPKIDIKEPFLETLNQPGFSFDPSATKRGPGLRGTFSKKNI